MSQCIELGFEVLKGILGKPCVYLGVIEYW